MEDRKLIEEQLRAEIREKENELGDAGEVMSDLSLKVTALEEDLEALIEEMARKEAKSKLTEETMVQELRKRKLRSFGLLRKCYDFGVIGGEYQTVMAYAAVLGWKTNAARYLAKSRAVRLMSHWTFRLDSVDQAQEQRNALHVMRQRREKIERYTRGDAILCRIDDAVSRAQGVWCLHGSMCDWRLWRRHLLLMEARKEKMGSNDEREVEAREHVELMERLERKVLQLQEANQDLEKELGTGRDEKVGLEVALQVAVGEREEIELKMISGHKEIVRLREEVERACIKEAGLSQSHIVREHVNKKRIKDMSNRILCSNVLRVLSEWGKQTITRALNEFKMKHHAYLIENYSKVLSQRDKFKAKCKELMDKNSELREELMSFALIRENSDLKMEIEETRRTEDFFRDAMMHEMGLHREERHKLQSHLMYFVMSHMLNATNRSVAFRVWHSNYISALHLSQYEPGLAIRKFRLTQAAKMLRNILWREVKCEVAARFDNWKIGARGLDYIDAQLDEGLNQINERSVNAVVGVSVDASSLDLVQGLMHSAGTDALTKTENEIAGLAREITQAENDVEDLESDGGSREPMVEVGGMSYMEVNGVLYKGKEELLERVRELKTLLEEKQKEYQILKTAWEYDMSPADKAAMLMIRVVLNRWFKKDIRLRLRDWHTHACLM